MPASRMRGLRSAFVRKEKAPHTPPHLARLGLAD